jgi:hypothetical protein
MDYGIYRLIKTPQVAIPTYVPIIRYLTKTHFVIIGSSCGLGGLSIMFGSGGLKLRAVAGRPSVTRLTQRS